MIVFRFIFLFLLSGCMVGPNYHPPEEPTPVSFSEDIKEKTKPLSDSDLVEWWKIFEDPFLDQLLQESISGNFDYHIALEQICQARSQFWIQFKAALPELDGDAQASHFRVSQTFDNSNNNNNIITNLTPVTASVSPYQNFFQVGFDAVWEIDFFGGLQRSKNAAFDLWQASYYNSEVVKITVLSEVANTYTIIRALQQKLNLAVQTVELDTDLLNLVQEQLNAGLSNEQELQLSLATLEKDKGAYFQALSSLKVTIYSLATLLGRQPETLMQDFEVAGAIPNSSERVPTGLPGDLLRRRPDIRYQERNLAAATEQIGVAVAELFPKISLTGSSSSFAANPLQGANIGYSTSTAKKLFNSSSLIWGLGAITTFPVFDWGKRCDQINVEISLKQQAYFSYQKTVITALQEVEQALAAYFTEEDNEKVLKRAAQNYEKAFKLTEDLYEAGLANYLDVIQTKDTWIVALNAHIDSQQRLTSDLIALYKALGGDWLCW